MKPLLALLCAVAIGVVAYHAVYPNFAHYFGLDEKPAPPPPPAPVEIPKVEIAMPKVVDEEKPAPAPEMKPEPKPEVAVAPPPPPPPPPKPSADEFVPPTFEPIESLTKNWTSLPPSVFPREIVLSQELEVKGSVGATKIPSGSKAFAIGMDGGQLVLAPSPQSPFRGTLAMDATNFKAVVSEAYARGNAAKIEAARKAWEAKLEAAKNPKKAAAKGPLRDDKPIQDKDGSYPILVDSMKASEVTEVKMDNIKKWGDVKRETVGGQEYWVVGLVFEATTPFGKFEQDAKALVKNQRVAKWIYAGSGEVIP